jgi:hypothetical protein
MAGLLDPTEDIVTPDERKAITQQNLFSTLLQSGMNLVAAGENLYPWQRAQMIAQAAQPFGAMPGNNQQMLANAAQMKLVSQKAADKKREQDILNSDEFKASLAQLPPEMQALARINPQGAISAVSNWRQQQAQAQREDAAASRQERMLQAQLDRAPPVVSHDEYGRLVAYDPRTKSWTLVNSNGGDQRGAYGLPGGTPAPQGGAPAPQGGAPVPQGDAQAPQGGQPSGTAPAVPPSVNTTNAVDYNKAFGLPGVGHYLTGKIQGVIENKMTGGNLEAANARSNYENERINLIKTLTAGLPGRQSKWSAQQAAELLPDAASMFTSKAEAVSKLDAAQRQIESEIASLNAAFDAPGNIKMRADIAAKLKDLYRSHANLGAINQQLVYGKGGGPQQAAPQGGNANITPQQALEELKRRGVK